MKCQETRIGWLRHALAAVIGCIVLAGCAGTNFVRPDPQALQVGKSTAADVKRVMGPPGQTGELQRNGETLQLLRYAYAEGAGTGKYPGVVPARAMVFSTHGELLVAEEFVSSFSNDATDFDETRSQSIVKGRTTRAEVLGMLGKPNGSAIYPFVKTRGETAIIYSYAQAKGSVFDMKFHNKVLLVAFDSKDVVTEVEFVSNGTK